MRIQRSSSENEKRKERARDAGPHSNPLEQPPEKRNSDARHAPQAARGRRMVQPVHLVTTWPHVAPRPKRQKNGLRPSL